jgi:hypothetical protein
VGGRRKKERPRATSELGYISVPVKEARSEVPLHYFEYYSKRLLQERVQIIQENAIGKRTV